MFASNLCPKMKIERVRLLTAGNFEPKILYLLKFFATFIEYVQSFWIPSKNPGVKYDYLGPMSYNSMKMKF